MGILTISPELILGIIGTITGVCSLIISVYFNRKLIKKADIDLKRSKILEEVQSVLTPAIDHLNLEIKAIRDKKIIWHRYISGEYGFDYGLKRLFNHSQHCSIRFSFDKGSWALKDILEKFYKLNNLFFSHDSLVDELSEIYIEIEKEIMILETKDKLEKMIKEFNEKRLDPYTLKVEKPGRFIGDFIINLEYIIKRIPDSIEPHIDFWEENQKELLKLRDTQRITEVGKIVRHKLIQLRELNETTLKELEKIREDYRREYNFTDNEVEPFKNAF